MHQAVRGLVVIAEMDPDAVDRDVAVFHLKAKGAERLGTAADMDAVVVGGFVNVRFAEVCPAAVFLGGERAGNGQDREESQEPGSKRGPRVGMHEGLRSITHFNTGARH